MPSPSPDSGMIPERKGVGMVDGNLRLDPLVPWQFCQLEGTSEDSDHGDLRGFHAVRTGVAWGARKLFKGQLEVWESK